jgi:endonuclease G
MNVLDAIRQTMRRTGGRHTRLRGTELFKRITNDWHTAEKLERVLRRMEQLGLRQEAQKLASSVATGAPLTGFNPLERIIGRSQLMSSFFLSLGAERARAVGRVVTENGRGFGTCFLITPRLLMTNNHVLESERAAARSRVEFDYVRRFDGSLGYTQLFRLLPADFFITSVARDDLNLDYTIVAVEAVNSQRDRLDGRGFIPLVAASGELAVKELANIIQHAGGEPQQVALRDSQVVESLEHFIRYEADTLPGSSGSPVFNDQWQLVALHHSGVPDEVSPGVLRLRGGGEWDTRMPLPPDEQLRRAASVNWVSNEGVRVSSIIADVQARLSGDKARRALFEEALREQPPPERIGVSPRKEALRLDAAPFMPEGLLGSTQDAVTWTIPLRVTMQLSPQPHFSLSAGPITPAPPSAPALAQDEDAPLRHPPAEAATAADDPRRPL